MVGGSVERETLEGVFLLTPWLRDKISKENNFALHYKVILLTIVVIINIIVSTYLQEKI